MENFSAIKNFVKEILESRQADFYRRFYDGLQAGIQPIETPEDFGRLPRMTREKLLGTPLSERTYKEEDGLVKIVRAGGRPLLIKRCSGDLREEDYASSGCERPLVLLKNSDETIQTGLHFYEKNILPLPGEPNNLSVTVLAAAQYGIDYLLTETGLFELFWPRLSGAYDVGKIKNLVLVGSEFRQLPAGSLPAGVEITYILSLPETGPFARHCPEALKRGQLIFHPDMNCRVEIEDRIILTRQLLMPTPIIRYDTGLAARRLESGCGCGRRAFALV